MGVVPAADRVATRARRLGRIRRIRFDARPLVIVGVLSPVAALAPNGFITAIAVAAVIVAAWVVGYHEGRADLARDLLERER